MIKPSCLVKGAFDCLTSVVLLHSKYHIVSLVQNFTKMCPDSSEENFCGFYLEWICDTLTTPLPVDGHAPQCTCEPKNNTEWRSESQACGFVWRPSQFENAVVGKKLACWTEGFRTADFHFQQLWSVSYGLLAFCVCRLILFYSMHLEGRQTVESHLVHTVTIYSLHWRMHVMTSSISIIVHFFSFTEACPSTKICTLWKLSSCIINCL